ncbi:MAG: CsiV family protein [Xanthomonadales bacterium]|jgi:hypothetical protein|nr:CsiV family protein [Xanthomonadales bacterium]
MLTRNLRPALPLFAALACLVPMGETATARAAEERYRVELIVFRNVGVPATPVDVDEIRRFRNAFELGEDAAPETPVRLDKQDGAFANIWARLDRLAEYEPLVRLTFEQTFFDYHPPVRVHGDEVVAEEVYVPGDIAYLDLVNASPGGAFEAYVSRLYRLDGTVQLRRSRFLHVDVDLEYRLDGPAWDREFPPEPPLLLEPGFEWVGAPPEVPRPSEAVAVPANRGDGTGPIDATAVLSPPGAVVETQEPEESFKVHRLEQSRQVRTNTLQYFDSAFLGAIVRVTEIADEET